MAIILAISGGVDSVVMLDVLAKACDKKGVRAVVAHFNHGMRSNAKLDAKFVENLAKKYGLDYEYMAAQVGTIHSEAEARTARYDFLDNVAKKYHGEIYTAHHLDDLVETVAINLIRGTGWRGLAAFNATGVRRPFLEQGYEFFGKIPRKRDLIEYAARHGLNFREDQSNSSNEYLRNRIRERLDFAEIDARAIYALWARQKELRKEIDDILDGLTQQTEWKRDWFQNMDDLAAIEILRALFPLTRPQALDLLGAIRTYQSGKFFNLPNDKLLKMGKNSFSVL